MIMMMMMIIIIILILMLIAYQHHQHHQQHRHQHLSPAESFAMEMLRSGQIRAAPSLSGICNGNQLIPMDFLVESSHPAVTVAEGALYL
jgi:predicted negative regulator of RcsB-dependent stress response